jgi:hypothetical protein
MIVNYWTGPLKYDTSYTALGIGLKLTGSISTVVISLSGFDFISGNISVTA